MIWHGGRTVENRSHCVCFIGSHEQLACLDCGVKIVSLFISETDDVGENRAFGAALHVCTQDFKFNHVLFLEQTLLLVCTRGCFQLSGPKYP